MKISGPLSGSHDFTAKRHHERKQHISLIALIKGILQTIFSRPKVMPFWTRKHTPVRNHQIEMVPLKWG